MTYPSLMLFCVAVRDKQACRAYGHLSQPSRSSRTYLGAFESLRPRWIGSTVLDLDGQCMYYLDGARQFLVEPRPASEARPPLPACLVRNALTVNAERVDTPTT